MFGKILSGLGDFIANVTSENNLQVVEKNSSSILISQASIISSLGTIVTQTAEIDIIAQPIQKTNTGLSNILSGVSGKRIKIYGLSFHNNETVENNDAEFELLEGGTPIYGGVGNSIYLTGRGGVWGLPVSKQFYYHLADNQAFAINQSIARDISGVVFYTQE